MKRAVWLLLSAFICLSSAHAATRPATPMELTTNVAIREGNDVQVTALMRFADGKLITPGDLQPINGHVLEMMIADPTLTDFHHVFATLGNIPGEFVFHFRPRTNAAYRVWAKFTPVDANARQYVQADMGTVSRRPFYIDKTQISDVLVDDYHFILSFDDAPRLGVQTIATITIANKDGILAKNLASMENTFGHATLLSEDYRSIYEPLSIDSTPLDETSLGGPTLTFAFAPPFNGFAKLFIHIRIKDKDLIAPFGLVIQ